MKQLSTCLSIVSVTILAAPTVAQNLIVNGGFETATVGVPVGTPFPAYPGSLDGWGAVNTDGEFVLGPTQAHTGTGFMSMLDNGGQNPGTPWLGIPGGAGFDRGEQTLNVAANTSYTLSYWYRAGDGSRYGYGAGSTSVQVEEILPAFVSFVNTQQTATNDWQQASVTFTTGASTTTLMVLFSALGSGPTDTWYDDVDLRLASGEGVVEHIGNEQWLLDAGAGTLCLLSSTAATGGTIELINAAGARVSDPVLVRSDREVLDLSRLASGAYVALLRESDGVRTHRFVLAR